MRHSFYEKRLGSQMFYFDRCRVYQCRERDSKLICDVALQTVLSLNFRQKEIALYGGRAKVAGKIVRIHKALCE